MTEQDIHTLLNFYAESGLDFPVADEAIDRFEEAPVSQPKPSEASGPQVDANAPPAIEMDPRKRAAQNPAPRPTARPSPDVTIPTEEVITKAVEAANQASDLVALKQAIETFEGCNLKRSARSTIFEGGYRGASIMMIGGAPSRDDDQSGRAFSGADGQLLDNMLKAIGLTRDNDVYLSYCVPWSPPGGSTPTPLHLDICAPFLARQIQLCAPKIVIAMGNVAARHVFQTKKTIVQARGQWTTLPQFGIDAIAIYEPHMLRAQPQMKRAAWMDLLAIKDKIS